MNGPVASYLDGDVSGRLGLTHGPLDLAISVDGAVSLEHEAYYRHHAYALANRRFRTILDEVQAELRLLEQPANTDAAEPEGNTARRMVAAARCHTGDGIVMPMTAMAGAVADEVLSTMLAGFAPDNRPRRMIVDNAGIVALHLDATARYDLVLAGADAPAMTIDAGSLTRGIARVASAAGDEVTVLAATAAEAEVAGHVIRDMLDLVANASEDDIADGGIERLVLRSHHAETLVHPKVEAASTAALDAGLLVADRLQSCALVHAAAITVAGRSWLVGQGWSIPQDEMDARRSA